MLRGASLNLLLREVALLPVLVLPLVVGAVIGLVNGLLIVKGRLNGFIVTLGMTIVLAGPQNGIVKAQSLFNLPGPSGTSVPPRSARSRPRSSSR